MDTGLLEFGPFIKKNSAKLIVYLEYKTNMQLIIKDFNPIIYVLIIYVLLIHGMGVTVKPLL